MWTEQLKEHAGEELKDHEEYMHLAEEAEQEGYHHAAGILRDIAHEEQTHEHLLKSIMHYPE